VNKRRHLGDFFQQHYQTGVGAEIGCLRGEFSRFLSTRYEGKILCVDYFGDELNVGYGPDVEEKCRANLEGTNCEIVKGMSVEVARTVPDESLDWVYIDADHRYEGVRADLEAWFPKVRKGGVVSGHDYVKYAIGDYVFGVIEAVDEFCAEHGYKLEELLDARRFASWWFIK